MRTLIGIFASLLIWGNPVFASLPASDTNQDLKNIKNWTAHLNNHYPTLDLAVGVPLNTDGNRAQVLRQLKALELDLLGTVDVRPGDLMLLACTRPECGSIR